MRIISHRILLGIALAVLWLLPSGATSAAVLYVDGANDSGIEDGSQANPYREIQVGLNAASPGDRVEVAAGTYSGRVLMQDSVDLIGEDPLTTIIDATGTQNSAVIFIGVGSPRLQNFTITGGHGDFIDELGGTPIHGGGGLFINSSSPIIENCIIRDNAVTEGITRGGGVYVTGTFAAPALIGNVISNNTAISATVPGEGEGGGLWISTKQATMVLTENVIENNQAQIGGGIYYTAAVTGGLVISRNIIQNNSAGQGAAIYSRDFNSTSSSIVNNLILNNGTAAGKLDCDDEDDTRSPDFAEICNDGIDNDCDDTTPDIFDADGDGSTCELDCDDSDPMAYPGAAENCADEIDNDCDGAIDQLDPDNIVLVQAASTMKYLANSADPGIGLDWVTDNPPFDASTWNFGLFGVGFEVNQPGGAENLLLTNVPSDSASVYARTTFEITNLPSVSAMFFSGDYDDGYVVWINGVEVLRSAEMPGGDPAWNAGPTGHESSNGTEPLYGAPIDISGAALGQLVEGTNLLAIGVYTENPGTSSDLVIVPRLSIAFGPDDPSCSACADTDADDYSCDDCDDTNDLRNPGLAEICNDTFDNDCDPGTDDIVDADADGFTCAIDCNDNDATVKPSAIEVTCDGVDNDCNPVTEDVQDVDGDQYDCTVDCNDNNSTINPNAVEFCFDSIDNNCDGEIDDADDECSCAVPLDQDGDTFRCTDCDDQDPNVNPSVNELCNDGINNDCRPTTPDLFDFDGDGDLCDVDCNDQDAARNTMAFEICNDGVDNDCDGDTDALDADCDVGCPDADGDGYTAGPCAIDCDDADPDVNPGALELCGDAKDNDCDPVTLDDEDLDGDGEGCITDCDDSNPAIGTNSAEKCDDLIDNDCDGLIDVVQTGAVLVQFGSSMRYLANNADPGLGLTWVAHGFNDNAWNNGVYGVGYQFGPPGSGVENLVATAVPLDTDSVYTRAKFTISDVAGVTELFFGADWDDGYVVWINGTEVARSAEMPAGPPTWDANPTLHESSNGLVPDYGTLIDISSAIPLVASGLNTLAVGIYNNVPGGGGQSTDLVVVPRLSMTFGTDDPDCLCEDLDNDGYAGGACAVDCDDTTPNISPDILEVGCDSLDNDCDSGTPDDLDADGDGSTCSSDCDDDDPTSYPGATEILCDFADNDCNVGTPDLDDFDNDGFDCFADCEDMIFNVNPNQTEVFCDGLDNDCNTLTPDIVDADLDGFKCDAECDDTDPAINPGAAENCNDAADNDCGGDLDVDDPDCDPACPDVDGDGYTAGTCDIDCDDAVAGVNPAQIEVCDDGIDNDCDPATEDVGDADGDGFDCLADCDDTNPFRRPNAVERCDDGIDNDCDPATDDLGDFDGDLAPCNVDCNENDPAINPGAPELCNDGIDNDCNSGTPDIFDDDGDGFNCIVDCDEILDTVNPGASEICNDGIDNDCNPLTLDLFDADSDGDTCESDCDDMDSTRHAGAAEKCDDAIDNDCDGDQDVADSDCNAGCPDADGDGYKGGVCAIDCEDAVAGINPGTAEVCDDALDNDCDPLTLDIDDLDGDGVLCNVDCQDDEPLRSPNLAEICNDGLDNDCNGSTNDVFDGDADGVMCDTDCDDDDDQANPNLTEVPCDLKNNDCDGMTLDLADTDADGVFCADPEIFGAGISAQLFEDADLLIANNTLVGNDVPRGSGGAIWADDLFAASGMLITNNVLWNNEAKLGGGLDHSAVFGEIRNNNLYQNIGGDLYNGGGSTAIKTGNMFVDPQFESTLGQNYRLRETSPLIDAADPLSAPNYDLDRLPRPYDGDGDLTAISDIGAFEYPSGEVFDLVFVAQDDVSWEVQDGGQVFNLYRGLLHNLISSGIYTQTGPTPKQFCGLTPLDLPYTDAGVPSQTGRAYFYLVTQEIGGVEGSLGNDSGGFLRPNDNSCP